MSPPLYRKLTKDVSEKMAQVEVKLSDTASQSNSTARELDSLQTEAENLDNTVKELAEQLEFIKNSDIRGEHFLCKYAVPDNGCNPLSAPLVRHFQNKTQCFLIILELFLPASLAQIRIIVHAYKRGTWDSESLRHGRGSPERAAEWDLVPDLFSVDGLTTLAFLGNGLFQIVQKSRYFSKFFYIQECCLMRKEFLQCQIPLTILFYARSFIFLARSSKPKYAMLFYICHTSHLSGSK